MKVKIAKETGYWALNLCPWGGDFRRLDEDFEGEIYMIYEQKDGCPIKFSVKLEDGTIAGFQYLGNKDIQFKED